MFALARNEGASQDVPRSWTSQALKTFQWIIQRNEQKVHVYVQVRIRSIILIASLSQSNDTQLDWNDDTGVPSAGVRKVCGFRSTKA